MLIFLIVLASYTGVGEEIKQRMADKKEAEDDGEKTEKSAGGKKKTLIIIIAVVLVLVIAGVGAIFVFSGSGGKEEGEGDAAEEEEVIEEGSEDAADLPAIFPLEVFIVNLSVKGSFLKTMIQLEFLEATPPPTIQNDLPRIRDAVIRVLTSKTAPELLSSEGKEKLRGEIKDVVNETLGAEEVANVYFTDFIIQ